MQASADPRAVEVYLTRFGKMPVGAGPRVVEVHLSQVTA